MKRTARLGIFVPPASDDRPLRIDREPAVFVPDVADRRVVLFDANGQPLERRIGFRTEPKP